MADNQVTEPDSIAVRMSTGEDFLVATT